MSEEKSSSSAMSENKLEAEAKPCPFCGGTKDLVVACPDDDRKAYAIHCMACRAWGPAVIRLGLQDYEAAWEKWNERRQA